MTKNALGILGVAFALAMFGCDDGGDSSVTDAGNSDSGGSTQDSGNTPDAGGGTTATFCAEECTTAADCEIGGANTAGFTCTGGRCVVPATGCTANAECVAQFSGWIRADSDGDFLPDAPCTADGVTFPATCEDGEVCCITGQICLEGGFCASPAGGAVSCTTLTLDDVEATSISGESVTVCGRESATDATCEAGTCRNPCSANADCAGDVYPTCNTTTGNCECAVSPNSCAGNTVGGTVCQANGTCGCAEDNDCMGQGFNTCHDGVCGCSNAGACSDTKTFDGTTIVCE